MPLHDSRKWVARYNAGGFDLAAKQTRTTFMDAKDWKQKINGCFGEKDKLFAIHPLDERRAYELLTLLRAYGIGWSTVEPEFRKHLEDDGCGPEHVKEQMSRISRYLKPWLPQ
jgi:hypothetical protein